MIVRPNNQVQPWRQIRRASLFGGVASAEATMLVIAATSYSPMLLWVVGGAAIGAAIGALIAYIVSLRQGNSLSDLEHDLAKVASIFERGLVDEAEYGRVKGQILESYRYTRGTRINVLSAALRGSLLGLLVPVFFILTIYDPVWNLLLTLAVGAASALVAGSGTAAVLYARRKMAEPQLGDGKRQPIDAHSLR